MTHPDAGRWVTAAEAPASSPAALGAEGVSGSWEKGAGEPRAPLQPETEAHGEAGQCTTTGTCSAAQRHVQGGALASPASAFTLVSSPLTGPLLVQTGAQRGAGACPRSHRQLAAE